MKESKAEEIKSKLKEVLVRENLREALTGFYVSVSLSALVVLFFSLSELLFNFSSSVRTVLFFVMLILITGLFIYRVLRPLAKIPGGFNEKDYYRTAAITGAAFPEIKDELINALQLIWNGGGKYSRELTEAAFERIFNKSIRYDFGKVVDFSAVRGWLNKTIFIAGTTIVLFIFLPGLTGSVSRIFNFGIEYRAPQKFYFEIKPGNATLTKGDNLSIGIKVSGQSPGKIQIHTRSAEQTDFETQELIPDTTGKYIYKVNSVKNSFSYFASADNIESDKYYIDVISRPIINSLETIIDPPRYTRLPQVIQNDNGNISAYPGSRVKLNINSSRQLKDAEIILGDSSKTKMTVSGSRANAGFDIKKNTTYKIVITDEQNISNVNPIEYEIKTLADDYPSIEVVSPGKDIKLGTDNRLSLISKVKDDFGFSSMKLNFRLSASKYRKPEEQFASVKIPFLASTKEDDIYYVWDLTPLLLAEGESVSYYLEIFDNDNITGPKSAKSSLYTIYVPSLDELFNQADNAQNDAAKDIQETLEEAKKLNEEMNKIKNDLRSDKKDITWEEKERIEKAMDKFKEIGKKMKDVAGKMNEMQKDLMQNNLLSEETMKKYMELQKMMDELGSEELRAAFERMNDALKNLMRDNVQQSMDDLKNNEEYFKKSIERTLNLLKRIQVEQKLDELVKRTEDISKKIEDLKQQTEKSNLDNPEKKSELGKKQDDAASDINRLNEEMKKLSEKMKELNDMPKEQMNKLLREFEKQNNDQLSKQASQQLSQNMKNQALQSQQQLSQNMQQTSQQLGELQQSMQQMNQMKTFMDMAKILDDLLTLSKDQENLKNETENTPPVQDKMNANARGQMEIQSNLGKVLQKMSALSQKTFAITPEMGKSLGKAFGEMSKSMTMLQNQNGGAASQNQGKAMSHLNEAAAMMKGAMDQMMNGGQGGGMMSLMQQLQQLSQQQMDLNQLTQMLKEGQFSQQQLAEMQRLAQQQDIIRKSLDQLNEEAKQSGESKKLASNLEKILQDMQEVVTNMKSEKLNDDLIKKQDKILSRLLDAQRSMNERDFEKERESTTGKTADRKSPPDLILSTEEGRNKLRDELMKAIREGYKKDYEELIRKYFEALEKTEKK